MLKQITYKDIFIVVLILVLTFGYFLDIVEENRIEVDFYLFKIGSFGFQDVASFFYFLKMKLLILFFSLIWYFTCKNWWKISILIIASIEIFKIANVLGNTTRQVDEVEFLTSLPITIPLIFLISFFLRRLYLYSLSLKIGKNLDREIDAVFFELENNKYNRLDELKNRVSNLKKNTDKEDEYLRELIKIRDDFYKI
ncbi:hypothetical protein ACU8DI_06115 [Psychroserpens sp. BH13MA-6]